MANKEIKKLLQKMIKGYGWNECYGGYGLNLSAGQKQMEKGNATIGFGYLECKDYDAENAYARFIDSTEFNETIKTIKGSWEREEKKDGNWTLLYIRIHF